VIYWNDGAGAFSAAQDPQALRQIERFATGDLDGDGDTDLFGKNYNAADISLFENVQGTFSPVGSIWFAERMEAGTAEDLDGDGRQDLVVSEPGSIEQSPKVRIYWNDGGWSFSETIVTPGVSQITSLVAMDVDHDGRPDIVGSAPETGLILGPLQRRRAGDGRGEVSCAGSFPEVPCQM